MLPSWLPAVGIEGGEINIVPVDFVADAIDHIAHKPELDGQTFSLTDPAPKSAGEVINLFARAADAPQAALRLDSGVTDPATSLVRTGLRFFPPAKRAPKAGLGQLGIPASMLTYVNYPTRFDSSNAQAALKGSGISVPPLESYADRVWDYWERTLDPDLFKDRSLSAAVRGKVVLITGASSGIGKAAAVKAADAGATVLLVARSVEKLEETKREIEAGRRGRPHPSLRHGRHRGHRADGRGGARLPRPGRHPRQQRRSLDPPLDRPLLRPLPRLRADDPAQLPRRGAADPGAAALDAGAQVGPHHQHQLDRHADQPAALLGLRRLEGGARRLQPA